MRLDKRNLISCKDKVKIIRYSNLFDFLNKILNKNAFKVLFLLLVQNQFYSEKHLLTVKKYDGIKYF